MPDGILETRDLTKKFDEAVANKDLTVQFDSDQLTAIIGPNGAGKTTFFNLLTGTLEPTSGTIYFDGEDITDEPPETISKKGLVRSFQITRVFDGLSVFENIRVAVQADSNVYNFWKDADAFESAVDRTEEILRQVGLEPYRDTIASNLSHGDLRTLEIAIALGTDPRMLLLDEPSSGMGSRETQHMVRIVEDLAEELPIVIVEHDMKIVMDISDRIIVLDHGEVLADGTPDEIRANEDVKRVYLGEVEI